MNNKLDFRSDWYIFWRYLYLNILIISIPEACVYIIQDQYFENNFPISVLILILDIVYCICAYKYILNKVLFKEYKKIVIKNNLNSITWKTAIIYVFIQCMARLLCTIIVNLFFDSENTSKFLTQISTGVHSAIFYIFLECYFKINVKRKQ